MVLAGDEKGLGWRFEKGLVQGYVQVGNEKGSGCG